MSGCKLVSVLETGGYVSCFVIKEVFGKMLKLWATLKNSTGETLSVSTEIKIIVLIIMPLKPTGLRKTP